MKSLFTFLFIFLLTTAFAQKLTSVYDPPIVDKDQGRGFYVDFEFTVDGKVGAHHAAQITLHSIKIDIHKGYFRKYFSKPAGKYYKGGTLSELISKSYVSSFNVRLVWEAGGKEYESLNHQWTGRMVDGKYILIGIPNNVSQPGSIPKEERANATVKKIIISSCAFNTSDQIEDAIRNLK